MNEKQIISSSCSLVSPLFNDSLGQVKIQALINTTIELLCSAYGFPQPSIQWSFNTNLLTEKFPREDQLMIESVQVNICRERNTNGQLCFRCHLDKRYGDL